MKTIPVMRGRVVRINFNSAPVLFFRGGPVKVVTDRGEPQGAVGLSRSRIQGHCLPGRCKGGGRAFVKGPDTKDAEPVVVISNAGICEGIMRIHLNGLVVTFEGPGESGFSVRVPVIAPAQIRFESSRAFSAALGKLPFFVAR